MANVKKAVTDMNAGWYNVVSEAMGLDPTTFRLAQGTLGLQTSDNSGLYQISDAEPPSAAVYHFDAGGMMKRSQNYDMLLGALLPEGGTTLPQVLQNQYTNWLTFRDSYFKANPASTETQLELFKKFANSRLNPNMATKAINVYTKTANSQLTKAIDAYNDPSSRMTFSDSAGGTYTLPKYSIDVANVIAELNKSSINGHGGIDIDFDSSSMDTTLKNTTVNGAASGFYSIFSGSASASFEQLDKTATASQFTVQGRINQMATLISQPIAWFNSAEFSRAYNHPTDGTIWDPQANAGDWNSFFDPDSGSLARHVSQLVFVGDYDITVTSHASYSASEYTDIQTHASFGIWPFFSTSVSTSHTSGMTHNEDGSLSVRHVLPKGAPQIWGVNILEAPS